MKVLVAGWFSFEGMGATAGDLICRDVVTDWLRAAAVPFDVAVAPPFGAGPRWESLDPPDFSHVIFVCGPLGNGWPVADFLQKFKDCELIGLNLTMLDLLENWNPFDLLLERDSDRTVRPDLTFLAASLRAPVVGLILADRQKEYGGRARHAEANAAIDRLLASREAAVVRIDTRLDDNRTGLKSAVEVESLIARMDVVITTRLHGTVLALKNGVPPLVIDPIAGGHKVQQQARLLKWSVSFTADRLHEKELQRAFEFCLTDDARTQARDCCRRAKKMLAPVQDELMQQFCRRALAPGSDERDTKLGASACGLTRRCD